MLLAYIVIYVVYIGIYTTKINQWCIKVQLGKKSTCNVYCLTVKKALNTVKLLHCSIWVVSTMVSAYKTNKQENQ